MTLERRAFWVAVFALAMAAAEAAVVVYLRQIFSSDGVLFPVQDFFADPRSLRIGLVEGSREIATVLMLGALAMLAGRTPWQRWAFFMLGFGLWDMFYYGWLYVFLGWPASPMAWDVLFLVPVVWAGPVLAPCLVALALIGAAVTVLLREEAVRAFRGVDWVLEVVAGLTVILACVTNAGACFFCAESRLRFPWLVFTTGMALGVSVFVAAVRRGLRRS